MTASFLLHLFFQVALLFDALGWEVKMPKVIHGLKGSCLVIPCSFNYSSNPPKNPRRVVWYQWASRGYPLVYDPLRTKDVIVKFRGKTYLYGNSSSDCSLLIKNLEQTHNKEKLYTWIDPENVDYKTYTFYDVTSTILVDAHPQLPEISMYGGDRMGDTITVTCSTSHTCPYSKPNITLNGIEGSDQIENDCDTNGQCRSTLTREGVIKAVNSTIECSVTHHGGIRATASELKTALCAPFNLSIEPELADLTEGVAQIFTCSVHHSCQRETPTISWNYENMQVSTGTKILSGLNRVTYSNITFLSAKEDHRKNLICTANISGINITSSVVLHLQLFFGLKTIGLYILTPSLALLLTCVLGVIIHKKRRRSKDGSTALENKPFPNPRMSSLESDPKYNSYSTKGYTCEAEYANKEDLTIYENC